jgi:hypothetical protein
MEFQGRAPDKWSIAEVTEHIAAAEDYLRGMVVEKVMVAPARPAGEDVVAIDEMVMQMVPDRTHKAQAPEPLKPSNRFGSPEASVKHFVEGPFDNRGLSDQDPRPARACD